jgi:hypothetical protein
VDHPESRTLPTCGKLYRYGRWIPSGDAVNGEVGVLARLGTLQSALHTSMLWFGSSPNYGVYGDLATFPVTTICTKCFPALCGRVSEESNHYRREADLSLSKTRANRG